jgi:hypothetical protein
MSPCKKLHEVPSVLMDWQQVTWCPDCDYYDRGTCGNPIRTDRNAACPFDGNPLPLREVPGEPNNDQPQKPLNVASRKGRESQPRSQGLDQAIKHQIVQRTGGRIQMLEVEMLDDAVVIRGCAPCYYIKQLALQGVLDVIGSLRTSRVELNVQVPGITTSGPTLSAHA